jgi:hypothetical protein
MSSTFDRVLVLLTLALAGCSGGSDPTPGQEAGPGGPDLRSSVDRRKTDSPKLPPGVDGNVAMPDVPLIIDGHLFPGCSPGLYQINAGTAATTCSTLWTTPDDVLQVTVGEAANLPPAAGRSYTVKPQSQVPLYPSDGDATAVYIKQSGSVLVQSGTFTVNPSSGSPDITGSYWVQLADGSTLRGAFRADSCTADCE